MQPRGEPKNQWSQRLLARVAQVQGEPLTRLQFICGLQDLHKVYHLQDVHRACALPTRTITSGVSFLSFDLALFASYLFWFFSLLHTHFWCQHKIYELAHTTFARKLHGANVQNPSNHQELASIGQGKHKGMMAIKECKGVEDAWCVYRTSTIFTRWCISSVLACGNWL